MPGGFLCRYFFPLFGRLSQKSLSPPFSQEMAVYF